MPVPQKSGEAAPPPEKMTKTAEIAIKPEATPQPSPAPQASEPETPKPAPPVSETPEVPAQSPPKILAASQPPAEARSGDNAVSVRTERDSEGLHLTFSFAAATPAALFRRADTVWLVFDSTTPLDVAPIRGSDGSIIADASLLPLDKGEAVRIRLRRPQMPSLVGQQSRTASRNGFSLSPISCRRRPNL